MRSIICYPGVCGVATFIFHLSYTHVYFGARELHACHTHVYGLELSITTVPSSYNKRLISSNRHAHITLLPNVCLLAAHAQALGGDPLQWGAANSRSSTPPWDYFLPSNTPRGRLTLGGGGHFLCDRAFGSHLAAN